MRIPRLKLYSYSLDTLSFRELRWGKVRFGAVGLVVGILAFWGVLEVNQRYDDALGLGLVQNDVLSNENRVMREQLRFMSSKVGGLEHRLAQLNERSNELRLLVNLSTIDEDVRKAGIGGTDDRIDFAASTEVNDMLNNLRSALGKAERELQLQARSYAEVNKSHEENKAFFAHLPAIRPMKGYYSKKGIGIRLHPVLNIYRRHEGLDIANDVGTPVHASADGVVESAGRDGGFGISVEINHGYGYKTVFAHLSKSVVREGQRVKRGDRIAFSGNTGLSSGPHLHYEVRKNGVAQNPLDFFFDDLDYVEVLAERE